MAEEKFTISGEIENAEPRKKKKPGMFARFMLFLLAIGIIMAIVYFPFIEDKIPALQKAKYFDRVMAENASLLRKKDSLQNILDSMKFMNAVAPNTELSEYAGNEVPHTNSQPMPEGTWYEVQIAATEGMNLERYKDGLQGLQVESDGRYEKVTLGRFTDVDLAVSFLKDMRKLGFKDCWVVAKKDGKRIPFDIRSLYE